MSVRLFKCSLAVLVSAICLTGLSACSGPFKWKQPGSEEATEPTEVTALPEEIAACDDGIENGDESDVDCGGSCPNRCLPGQSCNSDADCVTEFTPEGATETFGPFVCQDHTLGQPLPEAQCINEDFSAAAAEYALAVQCHNQQQDGDESDIDCGGSCPQKCQVFQTCNSDADCDAEFTQDGTDYPLTCQEQTLGQDLPASQCINDDYSALAATYAVVAVQCHDGEKNGDETATDCGGQYCQGCIVGEACSKDGDCLGNLICKNDICAEPVLIWGEGNWGEPWAE